MIKKNLYKSYPEFTSKSGSLVPLNLRFLYALIPCYLKRDTRLDCLFSLLTLTQSNSTLFDQNELSLLNHTSLQPIAIGFCETAELKPFSNRVAFAIINELCNLGEFVPALQLLAPMIKEYPNDFLLLSSMARIYLQMGNIIAAEAILNRIEQDILKSFPEDSEPSVSKSQAYVLLHTNRGFKALSNGAFAEVIVHFQKVLELDPENAMATNNLALGWLYNGKLLTAIKCIEDFLTSDFNAHLRFEPVVINLCTLYDLAYHDSLLKKRQLLSQAGRYLPDNFDLSALKIPDVNVVLSTYPNN